MSTPERSEAATASLLDDLRSGFLVFLIALPLCLGIALASGFPPVAGVLTAIIGGIFVSFLGQADLTIKGPAAGLIVIALGAVQELGQGDPVLGYKRALAVGVVAAGVQIGFALFRVASVGVAMSPSVVHGMLAAIGVIIISKQVHTVMGVVPEAKEPLDLLAEIPRSIAHANPEVLLLGALSLLILFGMPLLRSRWLSRVPAPLVVLLVTVPLGIYLDLGHHHVYRFWGERFEVGPEWLVTLPGSLLDAVAFPDFSVIWTATSLEYVVMYAFVGLIESTLSVIAVDGMTPEKKPSNLDRDLLAVGVGNLASASIGGLPMISEIVRSKANVDAGARSRYANFFHGIFLLIFVALAPGLLHHIPLAALAAMLVYTGARLASPAELGHVMKIGNDQLLLFTTTLVVTLATDLLVGVAAGLALKVILHWVRGASPRALIRTEIERGETEGELLLSIRGPAAFPSLIRIRSAVAQIGFDCKRVVVDLSETTLIDHTFLSGLETLAGELDVPVVIEGLYEMHPVSAHPHATRRRLS